MSGPDLELEERLRRLAPAFKDGIEPPATLHVAVMSKISAPPSPARPSMLRELSLAAALIAFVALLAFGFSRLHSIAPGPVKRSPSPSPASGVIPWISATPIPLKLQAPKVLNADQAAQDIRSTVTDVQPVLLPSAIPSGFQAEVYDNAGSFSVTYAAADGRKVLVGIAVVDPGIGGPRSQQSQPVFRGVRVNIYQVGDATVPTSHRWLTWTEPGTAAGGQPGVPYIMTTDGMTEAQFWQIANSIGPIPVPPQPPTCRLADLDLISNGAVGATGHIVYNIAFSNHGKAACVLSGFPDVFLVTKQGARLALPEQKLVGGMVGSPDVGQAILPPNQAAPSPHSGTAGAYVLFEWYYCSGTPPQLGAVDLTLPATAASRRVPLLDEGLAQGPSRCDDPAQGRALLVGSIVGTTADQTSVPGPELRVSFDLPDTLVAGKTVRYRVTMVNLSGASITFDTCPAYDEGFTPDKMVSYRLNCAPVGTLQAGASATFGMEFLVAPGTPPGPEKFFWRLHGLYTGGSVGKVVTVTGS